MRLKLSSSVISLLLLFSVNSAFASGITDSSRNKDYQTTLVHEGLKLPWAFEFVDSETMIFTERAGRIGLYSRNRSDVRYLTGVPEVYFDGQGGLLDIKPSPEFKQEPWVYVTYSALPVQEVKQNDDKPVTVLARFKLAGNSYDHYRIEDWQVLVETRSGTSKDYHFGSRIAFDPGRYIYFSIGDRGERPNGQNRQTHAGSILRVTFTGKPSRHNPFFNERDDALPEIWSFGHRNPQGLAYDPGRKRLWAIEHGPRGGDELNVIEPGNNYGWPEVSQGKEYWGPISVGVEHKEGMVDPARVYIPSIAPSSLLLYSGEAFPEWQGDLFAGALVKQHLNHIHLNEKGAIVGETRMLESLNERIRDVSQSPEGLLYLATDSGKLYRISPSPGSSDEEP